MTAAERRALEAIAAHDDVADIELACNARDHGNVLRVRRILRALLAAGFIRGHRGPTPLELDGTRIGPATTTLYNATDEGRRELERTRGAGLA